MNFVDQKYLKGVKNLPSSLKLKKSFPLTRGGGANYFKYIPLISTLCILVAHAVANRSWTEY